MRPSLLHYIAWLSGVLPILAAARWGFRVTRARAAISGWALLLLIVNGLALYLGLKGLNNHWLIYLSTPLLWVAVIAALIAWQGRDVTRRVFRVLIPFYLATWTLIVFMIENVNTFSLVAGPFSSLILLAATATTVVDRAMRSLEPHTKQDWFWSTLGLLIFYGVETGLPPLALLLARSRPDLLDVAFQVRAGCMIIAMLLITRGMLCPMPRHQSGGSSSRLASPSLSSLSRSG